ncbi:MAG: thermonuclease family protein [Phycisphaerae bacterium]|nr:thermonuclease family protein [Phycisphaerae bacterium]
MKTPLTALASVTLTILLGSVLAAEPQTVTAKVVGISDGDTLTVLDAANVQTNIRLNGIDAPEAKQDFGSRAKEALSGKVFGRELRLVKRDVDRYGRTVADVYVGERLINRELVAEGFAWHYVKYAPHDKELAAAEASAREQKLGLWADPAPIAPWDFRKPATMPTVPGMVYVTTKGKKYHTATCRHLNASATAIPLDEAKKTREPCKACRPGE